MSENSKPYLVDGMEQENEQVQDPVQEPATHVAIPVDVARGISKYFQESRSMNWDEANPYVVALSQGVPVSIK